MIGFVSYIHFITYFVRKTTAECKKQLFLYSSNGVHVFRVCFCVCACVFCRMAVCCVLCAPCFVVWLLCVVSAVGGGGAGDLPRTKKIKVSCTPQQSASENFTGLSI